MRWVLTKGKLPAATWIDIVTHRPPARDPQQRHDDVRTCRQPAPLGGSPAHAGRIQDETGGFTEFVLLPFVHTNAPVYLAGIARPGPTLQENRAVHAVARLMLHGRIDHIQTSWVKLGVEGTQLMLDGGADDIGGTLMEETISRMAGADNGSEKTVSELESMIRAIGRTPGSGPRPMNCRRRNGGRWRGSMPISATAPLASPSKCRRLRSAAKLAAEARSPFHRNAAGVAGGNTGQQGGRNVASRFP